MALIRLITNCSYFNKSSDLSKTIYCILKPYARSYVKSSAVCADRDGDTTTESSNEENENLIREKILNNALAHVPEHGWSIESLLRGAKVAGYPGVAHGMFPRGGSELIEYFYAVRNEKHVISLKAFASDGMSKKNLITNAVKSYLELLIPYLNYWPQAMGIMSLPENLPIALQNTMIFADNVWYYAGDKSTDINWYTKRISLATAYKMTELCLIQDNSTNFENTWQFLERRIDELDSASKVLQQVKALNAGLSNFIEGSIITARNIVGFR